MIQRVLSDPSFKQRKGRDILVMPFWRLSKGIGPAFKDIKGMQWNQWRALADFRAREGETLLFYDEGFKEKRLLLLGLGKKEELSEETLRKAGASALEKAKELKLSTLSFLPPSLTHMTQETAEEALVEGMLLASYPLKTHKAKKPEEERASLKEVALIGGVLSKKAANDLLHLSEAVFFARDLVIGNADDITPAFLAENAREMGRAYPSVSVKVLGKEALIREKMGLILAVSRGAKTEPRLIVLHYRGDPKNPKKTAVIGKGITFDTGGINLKPTGSVETQRGDMAGAAAALGLVRALALLKVKTNVTVVIPAAENCIDGNSYKPGDVYKSYNGKTVEIVNTDAEGRLVLADAIAYAIRTFKPDRIIDLATLTGAIIVALGNEVSGLFSNNDHLAEGLMKAGEKTYERLWRLPLYKEYRASLDSDVADIANSGGRPAGSIKGALFLKEFVGDIPWAHLDIAGTAYLPSKQKYLPKQGTGVMVRLLTRFFQADSLNEGKRN